jgi:cytochrome c oxidase cbb3-type subunit III
MSRSSSLVALALAFALASGLAGGCSSEPDPRVETGRALYAEYCALCHGDNGEGYKADAANALSNQRFLALANAAFLASSIIKGRPGTPMSPWGKAYGGPLGEDDVTALVALMRSWQTSEPIDTSKVAVTPGEAMRGQAAYNVYCSDCHGEEGKGGEYQSLSNPEFLAAIDDGYLKHSIVHGRPSTPMPAYGSQLTNQNIDDLVALIRSWQIDPSDPPKDLPSKDLGNPLLHPDGAEPTFEGSDLYLGFEEVYQAYEAQERMVLLDARAPFDYVQGHIKGAVSVPFYATDEYLDQLPKDAWIVCYCACPHAESTAAAKVLMNNGFNKVKVIDEGLPAWEEASYPMKTGAKP